MACPSPDLAVTGSPVLELSFAGIALVATGLVLVHSGRAGRRRGPAVAVFLILVSGFGGLQVVRPADVVAATSCVVPITAASGGAGASSACAGLSVPFALTADPSSATIGEEISFVASTSDQGWQGRVALLDGGAVLSVAPVLAGAAVFSISGLAPGRHSMSILAQAASASLCPPLEPPPEVVTVSGLTAGAGSSDLDLQYVQATIEPGLLMIATPYTAEHPAELGTLTADAAGTQLSASAPFGDGTVAGSIDIVDTRTGGAGWVAAVQAGDLVGPAQASIDGDNLGLVDLTVISAPAAADVELTDHPGPRVALPAGTVAATGMVERPAAFARSLHGAPGSFAITGRLTLVAPVATPEGDYTATLTFTVG
jgi:hypothetical protein